MYSNDRPRGFGFVCFSTIKEATVALETMNGYVIGKQRLYVNIAQSFEERRRLLRRLRNGLPLSYPPQPFFYPPPTLPTPSMLSAVGTTAEYTQTIAPFASMPFPLPVMVPPTMMPANTIARKHVDDRATVHRTRLWRFRCDEGHRRSGARSGRSIFRAIRPFSTWATPCMQWSIRINRTKHWRKK